jgi:hypothetical protein
MENDIFPQRENESITLNKLLLIFEIIDKISAYDNRGTFDFLTIYQFIEEDLIENPCFGQEVSKILEDNIISLFICALWFQSDVDSDIFSQAISIGVMKEYRLTKKELENLNTLIKELNIVFKEDINIPHVDTAVETIKNVIKTKIYSGKKSSDVDIFSNKIQARVWVRPHIVSRLLYFKTCDSGKMKRLIKRLPYGIIKNEKYFIEYEYSFSKKSFDILLNAFDFDFDGLRSYNHFLNMNKYVHCYKAEDRKKVFLISLLPNYDILWSRCFFTLHPRCIDQLKAFRNGYMISDDEILTMICR